MGNYFLLKTEPTVFSWEDLKKSPQKKTIWDGVRNYQARNYLRSMQVGDLCLFYHSNAKPNEILGTVKVTKTAFPDPTQFDPKSPYYDPKTSPDHVRWYAVEVELYEEFSKAITREELKKFPELSQMELLRKGSRLSVIPLKPKEFHFICKLAQKPTYAQK